MKEFRMIELQDFTAVVEAQNELNKQYSGEDWGEKIPKSHFLAAALAEMGELLESSPRTGDTDSGWKWWRENLENDANNTKIEAVDILHFVLSALILSYNGDIEKLNSDYNLCSTSFKEELDNILNDDKSTGPVFDLISGLSVFTLTALASEPHEVLNTFMFVVSGISIYADLQPNEMIELYMKKNDLNHKRIDGGYKEGKYEKVDSEGNEDNQKLFD